MSKRHSRPIDWALVEREMARSFRHGGETSRECERAYRSDPKRYAELHARVKDDIILTFNPLWKGKR